MPCLIEDDNNVGDEQDQANENTEEQAILNTEEEIEMNSEQVIAEAPEIQSGPRRLQRERRQPSWLNYFQTHFRFALCAENDVNEVPNNIKVARNRIIDVAKITRKPRTYIACKWVF